MGLKYKLSSPDPTAYANGSKAFRTPDVFASLAKVEGCPCEDGVRRRIFATAEADTFFTVPACAYVGKKTVSGRLVLEAEGWRFEVERGSKNADLIKESSEK